MSLRKISFFVGLCALLIALFAVTSFENNTPEKFAQFVNDVGATTITTWANTQIIAWKSNLSDDYSEKLKSVKTPPFFNKLPNHTRARIYKISFEEPFSNEFYIVVYFKVSIYDRHAMIICDNSLFNKLVYAHSSSTIKLADGIWYQYIGAQ